MNIKIKKYLEALKKIPASGGGGCHTALLKIALLGKYAVLTKEIIFKDLRKHIHGDRHVDDLEIRQAIDKAFSSNSITDLEKIKSVTRTSKRTTQMLTKTQFLKFVNDGLGIGESDFIKKSPIRIDSNIKNHKYQLLESLYQSTEYIFIADRNHYGVLNKNIKQVKDWLNDKNITNNYFIPNPLRVDCSTTATGQISYRSDQSVASFKFCVIEFDDVSLEEQLAFYAVSNLDIMALTYSGNKSVHALIELRNIHNLNDWRQLVKLQFYQQKMRVFGADQSCSHPARLSRLPGVLRDNGNWQKLIYLKN